MSLIKPGPRGSKAICLALGFASSLFTLPILAQSNYDFILPVSSRVYTLAVQPDGKILVDSISAPLRLNTNGTIDPSFAPRPDNSINTLLVQDDGKILAGGDFSSISGKGRTNLARFNLDGSLDTNFLRATDGPVYGLASQPDKRIVVAGTFKALDTVASSGLSRINTDGSIDATFMPSFGPSPHSVSSLGVAVDGRIIVGGRFSMLAGQAVQNLGRLNPDGSYDAGFLPPAVGTLNSLAIHGDGRVLAAELVSDPSGTTSSCLARFAPDGTRDTNFNPIINDGYSVYAIAVQADGKILVGGDFWNLNGYPRSGLGRFNADGSVDTDFVPIFVSFTTVYGLALQADGSILIGKEVLGAAGQTSNYVARLQNTGPATERLTWDTNGITWLRGGTAPEVCRTSFQVSSNGIDWVESGFGTRIAGGWRLPGAVAAPDWFLRARGWVSSGQYNSPCWFVQSIVQIPWPPPAIMATDGSFGFRSNKFGFFYTAQPNRTVVVQGGSNMVTWKSLVTNLTSSSPIYFSDPESPALRQRYYRLLLLP